MILDLLTQISIDQYYKIIYFVKEDPNLRESGRERAATDRRKRGEFIVTRQLDGEYFIVTLEVDGEEYAKEIDFMEEDQKEVKSPNCQLWMMIK